MVQTLQFRRKALELLCIRSYGQFFCSVDISLETFGFSHSNHLINSAMKRRHHGLHLIGCPTAQVFFMIPSEIARHPPAIAARGAKSGKRLFHNNDRQRRVGFFKIISCPKPGKTRANDANICAYRAVQRRARLW